MARARRRNGAVLFLLIAVLVLFALRRGGRAPTPASGAAVAETPSTGPSAQAATPDAVAPPEAAAPGTVAPPRRVESALDPITADRLDGCLRRAEHARANGHWVAALDAIDAARALPCGPATEELVEAEAHASELAIDAAIDGALAFASRGEILAACEALAPLVTSDRPALRTRVAERAKATAWPALDARIVGSSARIPPPLMRGRAVRVRSGGAEARGTVVEQSGDQVSLRVVDGPHVSFPVVPHARVEPIGASVGDAIDQCTAALRAGEPLLAALWLGYAEKLGGGDAEALRALAAAIAPRAD